MFKSKKAQQIIVSLMVSIMVFILVVIMTPVLKEEIARSTNTTNLNSSNPNMTVESQATTIILDMALFYFIGILIAASIAFITGKKSFVGAITAIIVFVIVNVLITPLKTLIVLARDSTHLNCASSAITVGNRLSCIIVDIWLFYFVVVLISVAVSLIFITKVIKK